MATQNFYYPPSSAGSANASVGTNGGPAPTSSTEVAGVTPGGLLQPISVDSSGNQNVNVVSSVLPTGASTSALQTTGNSSLSTIATNTTGVSTAANQVTGNNSLATIATNTTGSATAANQVTGNNSLATIVTNTTGIATSALQTSGNSSLSTIVTNTTGIATSALQTSGNSSLTSIASSNTTIATNTTGIATSALQTTGNTSLASLVTSNASILTDMTNGTQLTQVTPVKGTLSDFSGTTSGTVGTSTLLAPVNASRKYLLIENTSASGNILINFTSAATAILGSIVLYPGGSLVQETGFVSTEAINASGTVASMTYTAKTA